jgi:hypothetical protein
MVSRQEDDMPDHDLHLNFNPAVDNCFGDQPVASTWSDGVAHGSLTVVAHNTGTENINVVLEYGLSQQETGWFNPGETREVGRPLPNIVGGGPISCKILRWRPGFLGQPGSGGGEILFGCPEEARQARIELNVPK